MNVRHLATAYTGRIAAVAAFNSTVATWDLNAKLPLATFESVLEFGGRRLAIDTAGERCAAAAYDDGGLVCYWASNGVPAWTRPDLERLQFVGFSHDGQRLFCGSDEKACAVLDAATGQQVGALRGVRQVWESPFTDIMLLDRRQLEIASHRNARLASIERTTFGILDAAFAPGALCISESGGPVRCIDLSGREIWRYVPPPGRHVLDLTYSESTGTFAGVEWLYKDGGNKVLLKLDMASGTTSTVADVGTPPTTAFFAAGTRLLTSDGGVWDAITGTLVDSLTFHGPSSSADA